MLELIINGIFIGMGTAIGTAIGTFIYDWKFRKYVTMARDADSIFKDFFGGMRDDKKCQEQATTQGQTK